MAKNIHPTKHHQTTGDDAARALEGVPGPVSYDLLRVWIADRYQAETHEIAHELGLDPEPTWFSNEGEVDFNAEDEREKRDRWRDWKTAYNRAVQDDPARYRRVIAKICLQYADEFLSIAGITRPVDPEPEPEFPKATPAGKCPCGKNIGSLSMCVYKGVTYCSSMCPSIPYPAGFSR